MYLCAFVRVGVCVCVCVCNFNLSLNAEIRSLRSAAEESKKSLAEKTERENQFSMAQEKFLKEKADIQGRLDVLNKEKLTYSQQQGEMETEMAKLKREIAKLEGQYKEDLSKFEHEKKERITMTTKFAEIERAHSRLNQEATKLRHDQVF